MKGSPERRTARLLLRSPSVEDVDALFAIQGDPDAMKYTFCAPDRAATATDDAAPEVNVQMVFLNACDVGRTGPSDAGLGGFPEAFLRGGVGVLLGCAWAIDDEIGGTFSRHFYEALKTDDVGNAMRRARELSLVGDDLSALAYVAYAHPHARVVVA